jgi:hypothetical protein
MNPNEHSQRITALAERSSYVENVLRHALVFSLASLFWGRDPLLSLQVFNSEVDDSGFDVVLSLGSQVRYVQLKQTHEGKIPPNCSVRLSFAALPGACVVLMSHTLRELRLSQFRFFGASPQDPLPSIEGFRMPMKPGRRNAAGERKIRENYRKVPTSKFQGPLTLEELADALFPPHYEA